MLTFRHINLEISETKYNNNKIEVRQNINKDWDIWLNGHKVEITDTFHTRKEAIDHINRAIEKVSNKELEVNNRPKDRERPKACKVCGSTSYPHRCTRVASKEINPRRIR